MRGVASGAFVSALADLVQGQPSLEVFDATPTSI